MSHPTGKSLRLIDKDINRQYNNISMDLSIIDKKIFCQIVNQLNNCQ